MVPATRCEGIRSLALLAAARAQQVATLPQHFLERRKILADAYPPLGPGDGIVPAQTRALIGAEIGFATAT
jgi:hypothetical protein